MSGVELLMNQHQNIKAEIDTRDDSFTECFNLGKEMLEKNHYASKEVWLAGKPQTWAPLSWPAKQWAEKLCSP